MTDAGDQASDPRWWTARRAQSQKPATYRCPFCDRSLHAMSEHVLIAPEGDVERRRHAHLDCVAAAHRAGTFVTQDEWRAAQPKPPGILTRLFRRENASGPPPV